MRTTIRVLSAVLFAALLFLTLPQAASACNKTFVLYNRADNSIVRFYVAPRSSDSWEDDVLSNTSSVEPDTYKRINMASDTRIVSLYVVKAVFDDGSNVEASKINVCRARGVYIYNDHVTFAN